MKWEDQHTSKSRVCELLEGDSDVLKQDT